MLGRAMWWLVAAVVVLAVWQYADGDLGNVIEVVWAVINVGAYYVTQVISALSSVLAETFGAQVVLP